MNTIIAGQLDLTLTLISMNSLGVQWSHPSLGSRPHSCQVHYQRKEDPSSETTLKSASSIATITNLTVNTTYSITVYCIKEGSLLLPPAPVNVALTSKHA